MSAPRLSTLLSVAALVILMASGWMVASEAAVQGVSRTATPTERWVLLTFLVTIVVGEVNRIRLPGARESAPMSTAGTFGLAMTTMVGLEQMTFGPAICLLTTGVGMLLATALRSGRRLAPHYTEVVIRFLSVAVVALGFRWVPVVDGQAIEQVDWEDRRWLLAVAMVLVSGVAIVAESLLTAAVEAVDEQVPWRAAVADGLSDVVGLGAALAASGTLIALAERAIGVVAVPVFLLPLVLTQFALRRYAGIRVTQGQTIRALSRLTELGGYTRPDHPTRVAELSVAMARVLGVSSRDVSSVEYAALLHDIGQLALRTPIPQGATMMAAPADQDRIALDGAEIVRTTGVLADVADILEVQAKPYRHVRELGENIPLAARIIKVANAYDDLAGEHPTAASRAAAVERIHLGLGYEYDPAVVEALERVLAARSDSSAAAATAETSRV